MATSPWLDMAFLNRAPVVLRQQQVLSGERGAWARRQSRRCRLPSTKSANRGARERHEVVDQALESCHSCGAPLSLAWSSPTIVSTRGSLSRAVSPRLRAGRLSVSRPAYDAENIVRIDFCGRRILCNIAYKHFARYARKFYMREDI